ncbi:hypothetical protein HDU79_004856 [Rhizoclosmatium sp. JEL0117]|nr:hypothetical protein HDU79_004856 [Rhizoclosmatium sp. JEL0117]
MSEALTVTSSTSCSSFNNSIRKNPDFADVLLLIGPSKTPIWAHANILSEGCDYYKTALACRWIGRGEPSPIPQDLDIGSKVVRAVINHPDVDLETMTIVLEFIYAKTVIVPVHLLSKAALFADQLVLTDLVDECVKFIMDQVSEKNAFEYYMIGQRLDNMKLKVSSLRTISRKLNECIKEGKSVLAELDSDGICDIVQFRMFDATQKWMLSIVWIKSKQGLDDIGFDSGKSEYGDID